LALTPGTRLGVYDITAPIGEGGMGLVYRARDTKLGRDVALKILSDSFANDPERLARFTREAQTLASLNHPNIAHIHGFEESGGVRALVMELVEGEDLSQRIARGPIPVDESLLIAKQIAEALEAAHEHGIIHRDLKPANIKVRDDGMVKVLDFGLAKAMDVASGASGSPAGLSMSPTITTPAMTLAGIILGTAAYMAPEQARGKPVDKRADIWAFGVVVFEMLTGRRAFVGDDISITLASVMMKEPEWSALPAATPLGLRRLLTRCLKKDPKARMRDIGDARLQIEELLSGAPEELSVPATPRRLSLWQRARPWMSAGALALGLVLIAISIIALRRPAAVAPAAAPVTFTIAPPENTAFGGPRSLGSGSATQVAISPDGQNIVFVAGASSGYQIWLRAVATLASRPIPGTEGGVFPFWSPDSRFIGFFAAGKLKKIQIAGGPPIVLCDAPLARGGSWSRDDVILFTPSTNGPLQRVSSAGGVPAVVTTLDPTTGETNHRWPYFLPDGRHFLYTASVGTCCPASKPSLIRIGSLDPAEAAVTLFEGAESSVSYASGHLLFVPEDELLMAQPFDLNTRQLKGAAFPLAEHVSREGSRYGGASASENGTLVYAHGESQPRRLTWFDRAGRALATLGDAAPYSSSSSLALSRDEQRVAVAQATGRPANVDIWIIDLVRGGPARRQTFEPGADAQPVWSPDGTQIAFSGPRSGKISLRQKLVDETAADALLLEGPGNITPDDWSADGRYIVFEDKTSGNIDLWVLPLFGDRKPFPLLRTEFDESQAVFAPDGHWFAYSSNEGGERNVFVQPFPVTGGKNQISTDGGSQPVWRADGKELFYLRADGTLMAVPIEAGGQFTAGGPQALFRTAVPIFNSSRGQYAVTKDGKRFLTTASPEQPSVAPLTVVVNWTSSIQK
jgi:eukaryotic-like serine/threonine-protein kinase